MNKKLKLRNSIQIISVLEVASQPCKRFGKQPLFSDIFPVLWLWATPIGSVKRSWWPWQLWQPILTPHGALQPPQALPRLPTPGESQLPWNMALLALAPPVPMLQPSYMKSLPGFLLWLQWTLLSIFPMMMTSTPSWCSPVSPPHDWVVPNCTPQLITLHDANEDDCKYQLLLAANNAAITKMKQWWLLMTADAAQSPTPTKPYLSS